MAESLMLRVVAILVGLALLAYGTFPRRSRDVRDGIGGERVRSAYVPVIDTSSDKPLTLDSTVQFRGGGESDIAILKAKGVQIDASTSGQIQRFKLYVSDGQHVDVYDATNMSQLLASYEVIAGRLVRVENGKYSTPAVKEPRR